jgi:hypothetical protein
MGACNVTPRTVREPVYREFREDTQREKETESSSDLVVRGVASRMEGEADDRVHDFCGGELEDAPVSSNRTRRESLAARCGGVS